ncbi:hypothetical protein C5167_001485 [Papaver somniferum]|uniref:Uncharacterized protein n=1 Tax=Papaver somniferum TaxID=3469 RepID=A0A4Y7KZB6_PAPSO|nr:auxin-responsive protein SAUR50-like [Papaver somniferum]RZC77309.1 hypothetical protein C5167_001485 [Papaver somniferum]
MAVLKIIFGNLGSSLAKRPGVFKYSKLKTMELPYDVKKGQFAVFATEGDEANRFIVELECLNNPAFLKLLEKAEEEFGFGQDGIIGLPCKPDELKRILAGSSGRK